MKAATMAEPDALPRSALVGAWIARSMPPMTARTSETSAPFILFSPVEQVPVPPRLRAQILRRRIHLAAERGSRVPRPARVVEDAAGERHEVGIAGSDDRLGLLEVGDQPDGNHRHVDGALHFARERN